MNATAKQGPRIDIELRLCGFPGSSQFYEFQAMNSFGQEFIADELGLRGFAEARVKLTVKGKARRDDVIKRMALEGLEIWAMEGSLQ
jgi:hypothetical protein